MHGLHFGSRLIESWTCLCCPCCRHKPNPVLSTLTGLTPATKDVLFDNIHLPLSSPEIFLWSSPPDTTYIDEWPATRTAPSPDYDAGGDLGTPVGDPDGLLWKLCTCSTRSWRGTSPSS